MCEHWKFLHAADLRLGHSFGRHWFASSELHRRIADSPYRAWERLVETAIDQRVDALLLAGNVLDPRTCGAYALGRLEAHFRVLHDAGISVYWALGELDRRAHWSARPPWPANVTVFEEPTWERRTLSCGERRLELAGRAWSARHGQRSWPAKSDADVPLVVLASVAPEKLPASPAGTYWAMGGLEHPHDIDSDTADIHYCGALQPVTPTGGRQGSATLVQIGLDGDVQWQRLPLSPLVVLHRRHRLVLHASADGQQAFNALRDDLVADLSHLRRELAQSETSVDTWLVEYNLEQVPPQLAWRLADPAVERRLLEQCTQEVDPPHVVPTRLLVESVQAPTSMPPSGTLLADLWHELEAARESTVKEWPLARWPAEFSGLEQPNSDTVVSQSKSWTLAVISKTA